MAPPVASPAPMTRAALASGMIASEHHAIVVAQPAAGNIDAAACDRVGVGSFLRHDDRRQGDQP